LQSKETTFSVRRKRQTPSLCKIQFSNAQNGKQNQSYHWTPIEK